MNTVEKVKKSWWVILSFIIFLNGFGFVYIGLRHNNKNWVLEGIMYEFPWFFYIILYAIYGLPKSSINPTSVVMIFAFIMFLIGIIRSIWVAIKLADVYDNYEKYAINPVELVNNKDDAEKGKGKDLPACCLCLALIFVIFAFILIL